MPDTVVAEPAAPPAADANVAAPAERGASPAPGSAPAPPAGADGADGNIRQLRQQYETTKAQLERFSKLGNADQVGAGYQAHQRIASEASRLGEALGFSAAQIQQALAEDPVETLVYLRQQAAQTSATGVSGQDLAAMVERQVAQATQPFTAQLNHQLTQAAEARFDGEFDRLVKAAFPGELPGDLRQLLYDATSELMKYDEDGLLRVKRGESVGDVQRHFDDARGRILKAYAAWSQAETKRTGAAPGAAGRTAAKAGPTLDEIIADPSVVNARYK